MTGEAGREPFPHCGAQPPLCLRGQVVVGLGRDGAWGPFVTDGSPKFEVFRPQSHPGTTLHVPSPITASGP